MKAALQILVGDDRHPQAQIDVDLEKDWKVDGKCAVMPRKMVDLFFSRDPQDERRALNICSNCPVKSLCYVWAIVYDEDGTWGGSTANERRERRPFIVDEVLALWPSLYGRWKGVSDSVEPQREDSEPEEEVAEDSPSTEPTEFEASRQRARDRAGERHGEHILRGGGRDIKLDSSHEGKVRFWS